MSVPFQGSRLANLRQKRPSQVEKAPFIQQSQKGLTLLDQQDTSYQPSMSNQGGRIGTRFLKGRIQRPSGVQNTTSNSDKQFSYPNKQNNMQRKPSLKIEQPTSGQLKLVLNDSPQFDKKKPEIKLPISQNQPKRILIQKKQQKQQVKQVQIKKQVKQQVKPAKITNNIEQQVISVRNNKQQQNSGPIKEQEVQQSKDIQNQNELVQCPQGCGRKFNKKALQKHAKACKLVFMSKRKQFNSQAKRLTSQQQAAMVKQNKLQQKKAQMGATKGKGFDKTGDNWKAASEGFRQAIKAIKKEQKQGEQDGQQQQMKNLTCQYCDKTFAQVFLGKHLQTCVKRKQKQLKQKKKTTKKK